MGPDGHCCSLFPGHPLYANSNNSTSLKTSSSTLNGKSIYVAGITDSPKPPSARITLLPNAVSASRHLVSVITGSGKREVLTKVLVKNKEEEEVEESSGSGGSGRLPYYPIAAFNMKGEMEWFLDVDATPEALLDSRGEGSKNKL